MFKKRFTIDETVEIHGQDILDHEIQTRAGLRFFEWDSQVRR
jgi:hypothetical protein